jgi:hypothetical protein
MKKLISNWTITLLLSVFAGCNALTGEEVARLSINQVSTDNDNLIVKETTLELKKDEEIAIWSNMAMEYEGDVMLRFRIDVLKDGENLHGLEIDPTDKNLTIGEVKTAIMDKTNWRFLGKNGKWKVEEDGRYTFKAILVSSENPTLKIDKAEIVLKK